VTNRALSRSNTASRPRPWLSASLVVALCVLGQVEGARADERTDARRAFRAGMEAVAAGRYDEAIPHLERAYDILPHPNVLYNIGLAHMYAGRPDDAVWYFEQYKELVPPADAAEVDALIANLRQREAAAEARASQASQAAEQRDLAAAVETAAREVRRAAESEKSDALKRQADELDATAKVMRGQAAAPPPEQRAGAPAEPAQGARGGLYEEEVVSASRFAQSPLDAPNATAIITAQDIRMTGLTNVTDLLRRVAGVEVNQVAPTHAEVSIRGLNRRTSNKLLLLIDGRSHRLDFLGTNWFNQLPVSVEDIERIEIIRGPASALYGADAFAGIVNVVTRAPGVGRSYVLGGAGNMSQARGVATYTGRHGKLAQRYGVGYNQADNAVVPVGPDRVDVVPASDNARRSQQNAWVNGELRYDFTKQTVATLGGSAFYGENTLSGFSRLGQVTAPDTLECHAYGSLAMPRGFRVASWWSRVRGNASPSYITPGAIDVIGKHVNQDIADVDFSWSDRVKLGVPQTITLGGGYRYKQISWVWLDDDHRQHHYGGYFQDVLELSEAVKLQIGARVDRHPLLTKVQFSPRGSLVYRFYGQRSLRVSVGRAFRGPTFVESYLDLANAAPQRGVTAYGRGNPGLDPESILSYELGYQNQASDYLALEANVYFNTVTNAILFTDVDRYALSDFASGQAAFDPTVDAFPVSALSFTNERATFRQMGGELGARFYPATGVDLYTNYSIHHTAPATKSKIDPVRAEEQQTSLHKVNVGAQYRAPFGLDLSVDGSWFSPQLWVEQVIDLERGVRFQTFEQPSFFMLNGRIGYRFLDDRLDLGVVGTNLAMQDKRQHPFGQPIDTRVMGTVKLRL
jgi:outer membrane receptor for ferrienterochelin and colicin